MNTRRRRTRSAAEFAFEDDSADSNSQKTINHWPLVVVIVIMIALILLTVLICSHQYSAHEMKQLIDDGTF